MRFLHGMRATVTGKWWGPCPRCLKSFGSHERIAFHVTEGIQEKTRVRQATWRYLCGGCAKELTTPPDPCVVGGI